MKLSLVVLTDGKWKGKEIAIAFPQFVIGRDPQCHLRPASPLISKRHCAVLSRGERAFVKDFGSTNGTLVNDEVLQGGERELHDSDRLTVGPLLFQVHLESRVPVALPSPVAAVKSAAAKADDEAAALFLSLQDDESAVASDSAQVAEGSTIIQSLADTPPLDTPALDPQKPPEEKKPAKTASADTSNAARSILEKYIRRPRG